MKPTKRTDPMSLSDEQGGSMYVYLNSGEVETITSVSRMSFHEDTLTVESGMKSVDFPRSSVYFVSRTPIAPPSLF